MREQKNSLSNFIWMIFVARTFADISKSKDKCVEEFVSTLEANIKAAEDLQSSPTTSNYTALRLLGGDVLVGHVLDLHQRLCSLKRPEVVTIITVTKYFDQNDNTADGNHIIDILSAIQKHFVEGPSGEKFKNNFGVMIHTIASNYIGNYDVLLGNIEKIKMVKHKFSALSLNYIFDHIWCNLVTVLNYSVPDLADNCIIEIPKCPKKRFETTGLITETICEYLLQKFKKFEFKEPLLSKFEDISHNYKFTDTFFNDVYPKIVAYEKELNVEYYTHHINDFRTAFDCLRWSMSDLMCEKILKEIHSDLLHVLSVPENKLYFHKVVRNVCENRLKFVSNNQPNESSTMDNNTKEQFEEFHAESCFYDGYYLMFKEIGLEKFVKLKMQTLVFNESTADDGNLQELTCTRIVLGTKFSNDKFHKLNHMLKTLGVIDNLNTNQTVYVNGIIPSETLLASIKKHMHDKLHLFTISDRCNVGNGSFEFILTSKVNHAVSDCVSKEIINVEHDTEGIITNYDIKICTIDQCVVGPEIALKRCDDYSYKHEFSERVQHNITSTLKSNSSCIVSLYKITLKHKINNKEDCICVVHHRKTDGYMRHNCSVIFDICNGSMIEVNTHDKNSSQWTIIFKNVTLYFLRKLNAKIQLLQSGSKALEIPNFIANSNSSFTYTRKTILFGYEWSYPLHCFPEHLQKRYVRPLTSNSVGLDCFERGFQKLSSIKSDQIPNYIKSQKSDLSMYDHYIHKLILINQYKYSLRNYSYNYLRSKKNEQLLCVSDVDKNSSIIQLVSRRNKNYFMLNHCDSPIEIFLVLIRIHEENGILQKSKKFGCFYKYCIEPITHELLMDRFFDLRECRLWGYLKKMRLEMVMKIEHFITTKYILSEAYYKRFESENTKIAKECRVYKYIIKPMINQYVIRLLYALRNLVTKDEIRLTTMKLNKNINESASKEKDAMVRNECQTVNENFAALESYEEICTECFVEYNARDKSKS